MYKLVTLIRKMRNVLKILYMNLILPQGISTSRLLTAKLGRYVLVGKRQDQDVILKVVANSERALIDDEQDKLNRIREATKESNCGALLPEPLGIEKAKNNHHCYIETRLPGSSSLVLTDEQISQAIKCSNELSANNVIYDSKYIALLLEKLEGLIPFNNKEHVEKFRTALSLTDNLPSALQHGDYWGNNILFNSNGKLTGIVDWEESDYFFVGYDLIQLIIMNENNKNNLEAGEVICQFLDQPSKTLIEALDSTYQRLELPTPDLDILLTLYWLVFVNNSNRQKAISERTSHWQHKNFTQPLEKLMAYWKK